MAVTITFVALERAANGQKRAWVTLERLTDNEPHVFTALVPDTETRATAVAWLNANVSAKQREVWAELAETNFDNGNHYTPPEDAERAGFDPSEMPPILRAIILEMLDEMDAIRSAAGMPVRTNATRLDAVNTRRNA